MRHAAPVRQELGVRTVMNLLGPLTNPAGARRQVIGVFSPLFQETLARVLKLLDAERVLVVHSNGLDEIALDGSTYVVELDQGRIAGYEIAPEDFGIDRRPAAALRADSPRASLALLRQSLTEADSAAAAIVGMNAGAAIYAAGVAGSLPDGVALAREVIGDGRAAQRFEAFVALTRRLGGA
jgi:anthranilate phosphoribosyltransferase